MYSTRAWGGVNIPLRVLVIVFHKSLGQNRSLNVVNGMYTNWMMRHYGNGLKSRNHFGSSICEGCRCEKRCSVLKYLHGSGAAVLVPKL